MNSTEEVALHAQVTFMHRALRALVKTHPNPDALAEAWQQEASDALAHLGIQQLALDAPQDLKDEYQKAFWQWNEVIRDQQPLRED
ncbi:hypothetical protein JY404_00315 [Stenotrophomonas maltophilia]|uniref:hypothetical protein n=1 Tax=Stenotrophomonas TaxID=40323 RepID=UPI002ACE1369|nr:hypothetical protein [Stenotrophomonas pavanii]MBN4972884.1 hypothetical protein [Stenotrophomonas maltophilia]MDZ7477017.1 hypothetical protein [Stenotrophomonas pavanii]